MSVFTYTAKDRGMLMSGHSAGVLYTFEIGMQVIDRGLEGNFIDRESLNGIFSRWTHFIRVPWVFTTVFVNELELDQLREFYSSVLDGSSFSVDVYGSIASPDVETNMKMVSKAIKENRLEVTEYISLSFNAIGI